MLRRFFKGLAVTVLLASAWPAMAEEPSLARLGEAVQHANWAKVQRVKFTWEMVERGVARSYDWDVAGQKVTVTMGEVTVTIPASGVGLTSEQDIAAHKAFINDSYWLLFEHKALMDRIEAGLVQAPPSGVDPKSHGISVRYSSGGYTPGDRYVLWVGQDGLTTHWEYFPGGAKEARFLITREGWVEQKGVKVPTLFRKDGKDFIRISGLEIL